MSNRFNPIALTLLTSAVKRVTTLANVRERFRHRVLGEVDVAEDADQRGGAAAGFAPEDLLQRVGHPWAGRTSTGPSQAAAALPAHSRALSRSAASMIQKPPICSLVSA